MNCIFKSAVSTLLMLATGTVLSASMMDEFIDPQDGMFDVSHWLAERKGFFPVPIIITEPAVGFGLGAGLLFLHDPLSGKTAEGETFDPQNIDEQGRLIPPSVSGVFGAYTENGTWFIGGAHMGVWKNDNIRYTGALAQASANLKFYGLDSGSGQMTTFRSLLAIDVTAAAQAVLAVEIAKQRTRFVGYGGSYTVSRSLRQQTDPEQRLDLLRSLVEVAVADGHLCDLEVEAIGRIAVELGFSRDIAEELIAEAGKTLA